MALRKGLRPKNEDIGPYKAPKKPDKPGYDLLPIEREKCLEKEDSVG